MVQRRKINNPINTRNEPWLRIGVKQTTNELSTLKLRNERKLHKENDPTIFIYVASNTPCAVNGTLCRYEKGIGFVIFSQKLLAASSYAFLAPYP